MIKNIIRRIGQRVLGFDNYLFLFGRFSSLRMRRTEMGDEFRYFISLLPAQGTILDIGANIGIMSVLLAQNRPLATIYAFEPMPENLRALNRLTEFYRLKNVAVFPYAVGAENGWVDMVMPVKNHSRMQGLSHVIENENKTVSGHTVTVTMRRLDDVPAIQQAGAVTGIKLDVENFEYYVLLGAESLLRRHQPVLYCELWNDERRSSCIRFLSQLGYIPKVFQGGALVDFCGQPAINFFFLPVAAPGSDAQG